MSLRARRALPAVLLAGALVAWPARLAAQRAGPTGRWRVVIEGLGPAPALGELHVRSAGDRCDGTLVLSLEDRPPTPLAACRIDGSDSIFFRYPGESPLEFRGNLRGRSISGGVQRDGEPPAHWTASPVPAQIEFYTSAPRFTLTQLVGGTFESERRLPGAVVAAARPAGWREALDADYAERARRADIAALEPAILTQAGASRVLGLSDRAATLQAVERALVRIRAGLPRAEQGQFDRLFRSSRGLRTDFYGVALEFARRRSPRLTWAAVLGALQVRVPAGADPELTAVRALHGLWSRADTSAIAAARAMARGTSAEDGRTLDAILDGCASAEAWHRAALTALLTLHWVPGAGAPRSPADLVRSAWLAAVPGDSAPVADVPVILTRRFGDPQAVPRYGVPAALRGRVVRGENWSAGAWLERHGYDGLLEVLHRLDWPALDGVTLADDGEPIRLTSVPGRAGETLNGFLEPRDAIAVEPAYVPVLALGAVVHEWIHLLVETRRLARLATDQGGALLLPSADPWLAEGLAEAWSERVLAPAHEAVPLLAVSEAEKHARLARTAPDDPHVLGYLIVRTALAGREAERTLLRFLDAPDLGAIAADPALAPAWRVGAGAPDLVVPLASRRFLVPETTFTITDNVPDAVRATIRSRD
ncbi:MAG TPA: hypothetical protein VFY20_12255 [Gemmatimonadales bacterium]|nr:hypothetical protein [Gemmatimonadales bacterium]